MNKLILLLAVSIILILLVIFYNSYNNHSYLEGFWQADEEFLIDAGLTDLYLHFERPEKSYFSYTTMGVLSSSEHEPQLFTMTIPPSIGSKFEANIQIPDETILPKKLRVEYDIYNGSLILSTDEMVYGAFYKRHEID